MELLNVYLKYQIMYRQTNFSLTENLKVTEDLNLSEDYKDEKEALYYYTDDSVAMVFP